MSGADMRQSSRYIILHLEISCDRFWCISTKSAHVWFEL